MHRILKSAIAVALVALAVAAVSALGTSSSYGSGTPEARAAASADEVRARLDPSSDKLAQCLPDARVKIAVDLTTDQLGFDIFNVSARHLAPNRDYTVFLLEQAASPFGAAEYIGDITTDENGDADNRFKLIVEEAFSSQVVNGQRVRVDLNRVGMWFADPKDDDFCLGKNSPVTPFDGDNEAGVQVFNSRNADPLPAP